MGPGHLGCKSDNNVPIIAQNDFQELYISAF